MYQPATSRLSTGGNETTTGETMTDAIERHVQAFRDHTPPPELVPRTEDEMADHIERTVAQALDPVRPRRS